MNATAPAPTTVSSTGDVAHLAVFRSEAEWLVAFESGAPVTAYCGVRRAPRLEANDLPRCAECKRLSRQATHPAPLW